MKKIIALAISICILFSAVATYATAQTTDVQEDESTDDIIRPGDIGGYTTGLKHTVHDIVEQYKFRGKVGHCFAAERGNNLFDVVKGKKSTVVGDDNVKNGADRMILNRDGSKILIQDKYYAKINQGIDACFENGVFCYVDSDGNPMQIEVPSDQYIQAVKLMAKKIEEGAVPGISDPSEADTIIRKGKLSFEQAKNLAKAGNIDSLKYDATNGIISASRAFGISSVINYIVLRRNGYNRTDAIKESAIEGVKTGVIVFGTEIILGQLIKVEGFTLFAPTSEAIMNTLGENFAKTIVTATAKNGATVGQNAIKYAIKALRTQLLAAGITIVILSVDDVCNLFSGRISAEQLIKNLSIATAEVVGGLFGWYGGSILGSLFAPGVGTTVGGIGGSIAVGGLAGYVTQKILNIFIKDDAEELLKCIQTTFQQMASDYLVNEIEADAITEQLSKALNGDTLKEMFASEDRDAYAKKLMEPLFEKQALNRDKLQVPTEEEMHTELIETMEGLVLVH